MAGTNTPAECRGSGQKEDKQSWIRSKWPEVAFFTALTGLSMGFGFCATLVASKKSDPNYFDKGLVAEHVTDAKNTRTPMEAGSSLALRALRRATLYSVGGVSLVCLTVWKLSGASNMVEFQEKISHVFPRVPKNQPATSRLEFENLTDLFQYVIDQDKRENKSITNTIDPVLCADENSG